MRITSRAVHRYLGVPIGLVFLVLLGTGFLNALHELLIRQNIHEVGANFRWRTMAIDDHALALNTIRQRHPSIRYIRMPTVQTPYYQAVSQTSHWLYAMDSFESPAEVQIPERGFFRTALHLHRHFLLGKAGLWGVEGKYYVVWVGLVAMGLSFIGLFLWWPLRKRFNLKNIVPHNRERKTLYYSHMTGGVVLLGVIVLLALTGASISYRDFTQQLLGVKNNSTELLNNQSRQKQNNEHPGAEQHRVEQQVDSLSHSWSAWLNAAYQRMPVGARLARVQFPRQSGKNASLDGVDTNRRDPVVTFYFFTPGDWLGLAGSTVRINTLRMNTLHINTRSSDIVDVTLFSERSFKGKIYTILLPLHTGHRLSRGYVVVLMIVSFLGTLMVLSGLISFAIKKRKWPILTWASFRLSG